MDTIYNKDEEEVEGINLDSTTSTPGPPNPGQVIDCVVETETTEKLLEDYYKSKIDHNYPNLHIIQEIFQEEHKDLYASIDLWKSQAPLFINQLNVNYKGSRSRNETEK